MDFPGSSFIKEPLVDLQYQVDIAGPPEAVWPWLVQMGYHRGGWYIDTWWDRAAQEYFWPRVVPKEARGSFKPPAAEILPEFQGLVLGDTIPDGPPNTAYYEVVGLEPNRLLLLYATTHFNYIAPQFAYRTKYAPKGGFCWAFILAPWNEGHTRLTSWWRAEAQPRLAFQLLRPLLVLIDSAHQRQILKGIKKRVEQTTR